MRTFFTAALVAACQPAASPASGPSGDITMTYFAPDVDVLASEIVVVAAGKTLIRFTCRDAVGVWALDDRELQLPLVCTCAAVAPGVTCVSEERR